MLLQVGLGLQLLGGEESLVVSHEMNGFLDCGSFAGDGRGHFYVGEEALDSFVTGVRVSFN